MSDRPVGGSTAADLVTVGSFAPTSAAIGAPPSATAGSTGLGGSTDSRVTDRPWWSRPALGVIALGTAVLYLWNLSINGYGNSFYAAAVKSGTVSWKAFFFGSLDPGSFITVDKPPAALWVQEISARIFGFSSWSILAPEALAGVLAVVVLHHLVRKWAGDVAAVLAAVSLALTPVAAVMFRFNNPDALLTLLMVLGALALWKALETGGTLWLALSSALIGLAFTTKMLQGWIVVPALALTYLICGPPKLARRIVQLAVAGVVLVVASGWWVLIVELWPAASRPYIDNSTNNSELNLIFGYNGLSRIFGSGGGGRGGGGGAFGGGGFGGSAGWTRMFASAVGGQVSWLIPLGLLGLVAGLWVSRRRPRTDLLRAGFILWGMWTLTHMAVFSKAAGIFHPYYTVALAPGVAALAGAGAVALWQISRARRWWAWLLPVAVVGSAAWSAELLSRTPHYQRGLGAIILGVGSAAAVGLLIVCLGLSAHRLLVAGAGTAGVAALLAGPTAFTVTTVNSVNSSALATAGPSGGASGAFGGGRNLAGLGGADASELGRLFAERGGAGFGGFGGGNGGPGGFGGAGGFGGGNGGSGSTNDKSLVRYLDAHRDGAKFIVAASTSMTTEGIILASGAPVITIGGFSGTDAAPTLAQFQRMVAKGEVRYLLVSGGGAGGGRGPGGGGGRGTSAAIDAWVEAHGTKVPAADFGGSGTLYLITPAAVGVSS